MDMEEMEKSLEAFLGEGGENGIRKARVLIASGYNVLEKTRKALDAANELADAVAHSREKMKDGYEQAKVFIAPGMLKNIKDVYALLKKFGIIGALEGMKNERKAR